MRLRCFVLPGCQYFCKAAKGGMNSELWRVLKIAIAVAFIVLSLNFSGRTEKRHGEPQDSVSPGRDLNPGPISVYELSVRR
jgi:hypothetical protein